MTKTCTICKRSLPLDDFDPHPFTKDRHGSQCRRCGGEQRTRRNQQRKKELIKLLGGACSCCGYDKCPAALDFHHTNGDKEEKVTTLMRKSFARAIEEAQKCTLLCANCHREEHYTDKGPPLGKRRRVSAVCGTSTGYTKCGPPKCEICRSFKRQQMTAYRQRKKSIGG